MEPQTQSQNQLTIPLAIIIAGALIAAAIFVSNKAQNAEPVVKTKLEFRKASITVPTPTATDHILGTSNADIVMIEYSDTECPFCKSFHPVLSQVTNEYGKDGKVAWIYRHYPLYKPNASGSILHSKAGKEAEATECVAELGGNQKFWEYINEIYRVTPSNDKLDLKQLPVLAKQIGIDTAKFNTCLSSGKYADKVEKNYQEAVLSGANGTPHMVLLLKNPISDDKAAQILQNVVDEYNKFQLGSPFPTSIFTIDNDGKKISFSAALPIELMKTIVETILAK